MKALCALVFLASCASAPGQLSKKAEQIEVYQTKPAGCKVLGRVVGMDKKGSKELAQNHALNQAADLKASGIFVNQEVPNGSSMAVHATAYACE